MNDERGCILECNEARKAGTHPGAVECRQRVAEEVAGGPVGFLVEPCGAMSRLTAGGRVQGLLRRRTRDKVRVSDGFCGVLCPAGDRESRTTQSRAESLSVELDRSSGLDHVFAIARPRVVRIPISKRAVCDLV